ncbi:MAG: hypothetical protein E7610_05630 [Ruminococcaceae bacterium]|nr:hypothetical protein [Oscillospiraceae bacterium]
MAFLNTEIPELSGFDTGLCLSNLDILSLRQIRVSESILAVLSELADALIHDAEGDPDTVNSILLSLQSSPDSAEESPLQTHVATMISPINREDVFRMSSRAGLCSRLLLYKMIEERMPARDELPPVSSVPATVRGRVAYMPGSFADKAYLRLTASLKNPRAAYTASFVDACEEVHSGLCEYCILPLENSSNGRLTAFARLILRYRLQIIAVCDLENGAAPGQSTRFALLREADDTRFPSLPATTAPDAPLCLELIHLTDSPSLIELLTAAEFCGLSLCRVDTLPLFDELEVLSGDSAPQTATSCVLNVENGNLTVFRRFLALEAPEDILTGLYSFV